MPERSKDSRGRPDAAAGAAVEEAADRRASPGGHMTDGEGQYNEWLRQHAGENHQLAREATDNLLRIHGPELFAYARRLNRNDPDPVTAAEDDYSEGIAREWRARLSYDPTQSWTTWVSWFISRARLDRLRAIYNKRPPGTRVNVEETAAVVDPMPDPAQQVADSAQLNHCLAELERTRPECHQAFVLHDMEGVPMNDVARAMKRPIATAYARLAQARILMAECFWNAMGGRR